MTNIQFNQDFDPQHGKAVQVSENITRITAKNESPFTFSGTNTYLVGQHQLALIDPGPLDDTHLKVILQTIGSRDLTHIFVTHTHKDHSPLTKALAAKTGAKVYAEGVHRPARALQALEKNPLQESNDEQFLPDHALTDGQLIKGDGWSIEAVHTPGHTTNHCAYAFLEENTLFSGDHVMAWSTSIVAPPDGNMKDYMASLDMLIKRGDETLLPGHGPHVIEPLKFLTDLKNHRLARKKSILDAISEHQTLDIKSIVSQIYIGLDPNLHSAAALSVLAHLEELVEEQTVVTEGYARLDGLFSRG